MDGMSKPLLLSTLAAVLALIGCGGHPAGPTLHESRSIDRDASKSLRVNLQMNAGSLKLSGGAPNFLHSDFTYNVASFKPNVQYKSLGDRGELTVQQPSESDGHSGDSKNEWDLQLNNDVSTDLTAHIGAGEVKLDIGAMLLHSVDIEMGAGELRLDLRGNPKQGFDVRVRGGAGEANIYLPKDAGLSVKAKGGIGEIEVRGLRQDGDRWVNDAYEKAKVRVRLDAEGGVGAIHIIAE
jgi:hypothetical protein